MRHKTENDILRYIDFLREAGYSVTVSCVHPSLQRSIPRLLPYEAHLCDVCVYLKSHAELRHKCTSYKQLLVTSTKMEPLYECCWAGVEEYVFPILCSNQLICRIHISGFRGSLRKAERRARVLAERRGREFTDLYRRLSEKIPAQEATLRLVNPFYYMFQVLYQENLSESPENDRSMELYLAALRYIGDHFMENIQIDTIAQAVNYSASHLRTVFLEYNSLSIMEYVNAVRLRHAANLLKYSTLPITKIAYECGFRDSNYFSTAFKKYYHVTPRQYRK